MVDAVKHPAKYTDTLLTVVSQWLQPAKIVLDPLGGTGKLAHIKQYGFKGLVYINEIEREWADQAKDNGADEVHCADACELPFRDNFFHAVCTSPVYGNKMSEHANWTDGSQRHTYKSYLGRDLHPNNAGRFYFQRREYADIHWKAWQESARVVVPGGYFILNASNFIKAGEVVNVVGWHAEVLSRFGLRLIRQMEVDTPRNRHGSNHDKRVPSEHLMMFQLHK